MSKGLTREELEAKARRDFDFVFAHGEDKHRRWAEGNLDNLRAMIEFIEKDKAQEGGEA